MEIKHRVMRKLGRVIAQAVSRRLLSAAARDRARVRSCGICGRQSGTGVGFLQVLRVPLPIRIPLIAPQSSSSSIIWGWYNRPDSVRSTKWTQYHPMGKKNNAKACFMISTRISIVFLFYGCQNQ
jgi:hypothetical protein